MQPELDDRMRKTQRQRLEIENLMCAAWGVTSLLFRCNMRTKRLSFSILLLSIMVIAIANSNPAAAVEHSSTHSHSSTTTHWRKTHTTSTMPTIMASTTTSDSTQTSLTTSDAASWTTTTSDSAATVSSSTTIVATQTNSTNPSGNACSYRVSIKGALIYAQNCSTGSTDYSGTNPATVINDAIGNMRSGGKLFIMAGTYTFTTTPITIVGTAAAIGSTSISNVELFGQGNSTILRGGTELSGNFELIGVLNAKNWYIHDLQVDGNAEHQTRSGFTSGILLWNCDYSRIQNVFVHDNKDMGIDTEKSASISILNSYVKNSYANGIEVTAGSNILIQGNTVVGSSDVGISISGDNVASGSGPITNVICTGNTIERFNLGISPYGSNAAIGLDIGDNGFSTHVLASGNRIYGSGNDGVEVNPGLGTNLDITVSNNQISATSLQGIYGTRTTHLLIVGNLIDDSGNEAILTTSSVTGLSVSDNYMNATTNTGIYIQNANALVNGNSVQNSHVGIWTTGPYTNIVNNTVLGFYGVSLDTGSNNTSMTGNYVHATYQAITVASSDDVVSNNRIYPAAIAAIVINAGTVGTVVTGNDVRNTTYPIQDNGGRTEITDNAGYNPVGEVRQPFVYSSETILDSGGSTFSANATTMTVWESPKTISVLISSAFTPGHTFILKIDGTRIASISDPSVQPTPYVFTLQPGQTFYCQYEAGKVTFVVSGD